MKKLILLVLLAFSLNTFAQKQQVVKEYTTAIAISSEGERSEWFDTNIKIFFNNNNENDKVKIYFENEIYYLTQISDTIESETVGGYKYSQIELKDTGGKVIFIQVFHDTEFGVRVILGNLSSIQFTN